MLSLLYLLGKWFNLAALNAGRRKSGSGILSIHCSNYKMWLTNCSSTHVASYHAAYYVIVFHCEIILRIQVSF
jgi:hypothetical protein